MLILLRMNDFQFSSFDWVCWEAWLDYRMYSVDARSRSAWRCRAPCWRSWEWAPRSRRSGLGRRAARRSDSRWSCNRHSVITISSQNHPSILPHLACLPLLPGCLTGLAIRKPRSGSRWGSWKAPWGYSHWFADMWPMFDNVWSGDDMPAVITAK